MKRIEPNYDGQGTAVTSYKVVDETGATWFIGSYTECYNYLHPISQGMYRNVWEAGDGTINKYPI